MNKHYSLIMNIFIFLCFGLVTTAWSQIPNSGFENWTSGNPDGWETDNNAQANLVTQTNDSHSGSSALQGSVVSFMGFTISPTANVTFPYNGRPASLTGFYKLSTSNNDSLVITISLYNSSNPIGGGVFTTAASVSSYTQFTANILYISQDTPDSCGIAVLIEPVTGAQATTQFKLDDLAFSGSSTAVNETATKTPQTFRLFNNYPNPFNPSTKISYELPQRSFVSLKVFNLLGKEVATLVNEEKQPGTYSIDFNAVNLPSGIYFCAIKAGNYYQVNKMTLLK